ncbi:hypothetical protein DTL21_02565 [Bremerella cremea]|uniref:Flagellar protein FlgJ N-terminal domain-containing protein n=1 Tax=Blastopirellula marina TaxID=124 RepID=A0A2S8G5D1_9BACT|nr:MULTISPECIES: rod-binding protein [Pirellulaceae]PQO39648.1 hypothetical protein C5Y83_02565 [Blastopirellula marina]RCS51115.1 hypothetical protein DTL21_02565 [Bremerella cremea]
MNATSISSNTSSAAPQSELRDRFDQFVGESLFGQMLQSMRKSLGKPAYFHGGRAEEVFQSQLDQLLVEKISDASAEQITEPMYELFAANMGQRHDASQMSEVVSEQEAKAAIGQLDNLQRQNQSQDSQADSTILSKLDLSI